MDEYTSEMLLCGLIPRVSEWVPLGKRQRALRCSYIAMKPSSWSHDGQSECCHFMFSCQVLYLFNLAHDIESGLYHLHPSRERVPGHLELAGTMSVSEPAHASKARFSLTRRPCRGQSRVDGDLLPSHRSVLRGGYISVGTIIEKCLVT